MLPGMSRIAVFGSSQSIPGDENYEAAQKLGRLLAQREHAVINGGYGGLMEAVSAGAAGAGGEVIGVTVPRVFPGRSGANAFLTAEHQAPDLIGRIRMMLEMADAAVALTGSIGTLTELVMAWNLNYVTQFSTNQPIPLVAVGEPWLELVPLLAEKVGTDGDLVACVETVDAAVAYLDLRIP